MCWRAECAQVVKKVAKAEQGTAASASSSSDNEWLTNANISQRYVMRIFFVLCVSSCHRSKAAAVKKGSK